MMTADTTSVIFTNVATGVMLGASTWLGLEIFTRPRRCRWVIPVVILLLWGAAITWATGLDGPAELAVRRTVNGAAQFYVAWLLIRHARQVARERREEQEE